MFTDKFLRICLGLFVGAWVARYLGPEQFGELSYIVALVGLFQAATQLGLDNIAIRDISRNPESATEILGTIFRLRIVSGFLCYTGVIVTISTLRPADDEALVLSAIVAGVIIFQSADTIDLWFQSALQSKRTVLAKSIAYISVNIAKVFLVAMHLPLVTFAAAILVEAALSAFALVYSYKRYPTKGKWQWSTKRGRDLFVEGIPFLISGVVLTAYMQVDRLLLEGLMGSSELGYYAAALNLSSVFGFLPIILCASLAPKIAKIVTQEERKLFFVRLYSVLWWCGTIIAVLIYVLAEPLIAFLYGHEYRSSVLVLQIHAFTLIPIFLSVANDYLALNTGRARVTLIKTILGLAVNISLNILLIPHWGAPGAAISSLAAHLISNSLFYWLLMQSALGMHLKAIIIPFTEIYTLIKMRAMGSK